MRTVLRTLAILILGPIVGLGIGAGISAAVSGTWFARDILRPVGFTVSPAGAGTGELLVPEEPKEVSPPTVFVAHGPLRPAISPEEEIPPRPVVVVVSAPAVTVPIAPAPKPKPVVTPPPAPEKPWVNILPKEDFLRGESFRRFVRFNGKTYETWKVAFSPRAGVQIRTPLAGRVSTTGRITIDGAWYPTISVEGVLADGRKFDFYVGGPGIRPAVKSGAVGELEVLGEVVEDTSRPFEGRYSLLIGVGVLGVVDSTTLYIDDLPLLKEFFPHISF